MRWKIAPCIALIAAPLWAASAAAPPPPADPEIVVNGKRIILEGGEWEFDRSTGITQSAGLSNMPASNWRACLPTGSQVSILRRLLGAMPAVQTTATGGTICGQMGFRIRGNRVVGHQNCSILFAGVLPARTYHRSQRMIATVGEDQVAVEFDQTDDMPPPSRSIGIPSEGLGLRRFNWRLAARRVGACPLPNMAASRSRVTPPLLANAEPAPTAIPPRVFLEPLNVSLTITEDMLASPLTAARDALPASEDDIVVIGRRLRRAKLHFANEGRLLTWCHTDVSTGDARVDRIACAIVQACVREGVTDLLPVRACYARKVAYFDDAVHAARSRAPSS
ncbi:hypothetical protein HL653_08800 [Sphingomonas sp. AP4-R1]|uniref:hypothetical protein n=1 Tax=Sphingomonas sp. AP4-R1 TaxID=2735134 RepID=UPI001493D2F3|nr:hypothetical protein [Sphingomonas sp. AP4-R1]QJU57878.1 hypothetical protein HL653_08800 [Sphingomonas sp. AP4-R1]